MSEMLDDSNTHENADFDYPYWMWVDWVAEEMAKPSAPNPFSSGRGVMRSDMPHQAPCSSSEPPPVPEFLARKWGHIGNLATPAPDQQTQAA